MEPCRIELRKNRSRLAVEALEERIAPRADSGVGGVLTITPAGVAESRTVTINQQPGGHGLSNAHSHARVLTWSPTTGVGSQEQLARGIDRVGAG